MRPVGAFTVVLHALFLLGRDALRLGAAGAVAVYPAWALGRQLPHLDVATVTGWMQAPPPWAQVEGWLATLARLELWDTGARFALLLVVTLLARGTALLDLPGALVGAAGHWLATWVLALVGVALAGGALLLPAIVVMATQPHRGSSGPLSLEALAHASWSREGVALASAMAAAVLVLVLMGGLLVVTPAALEERASATGALRRAVRALRGHWGTAASVIFLLQLLKLGATAGLSLVGTAPLAEVLGYGVEALLAPMPALAGLAMFRRLDAPGR
jgi:hypothetical protein